jgi:hypothetical protein
LSKPITLANNPTAAAAAIPMVNSIAFLLGVVQPTMAHVPKARHEGEQ